MKYIKKEGNYVEIRNKREREKKKGGNSMSVCGGKVGVIRRKET